MFFPLLPKREPDARGGTAIGFQGFREGVFDPDRKRLAIFRTSYTKAFPSMVVRFYGVGFPILIFHRENRRKEVPNKKTAILLFYYASKGPIHHRTDLHFIGGSFSQPESHVFSAERIGKYYVDFPGTLFFNLHGNVSVAKRMDIPHLRDGFDFLDQGNLLDGII